MEGNIAHAEQNNGYPEGSMPAARRDIDLLQLAAPRASTNRTKQLSGPSRKLCAWAIR